MTKINARHRNPQNETYLVGLRQSLASSLDYLGADSLDVVEMIMGLEKRFAQHSGRGLHKPPAML